jgi:hypothetical protein
LIATARLKQTHSGYLGSEASRALVVKKVVLSKKKMVLKQEK